MVLLVLSWNRSWNKLNLHWISGLKHLSLLHWLTGMKAWQIYLLCNLNWKIVKSPPPISPWNNLPSKNLIILSGKRRSISGYSLEASGWKRGIRIILSSIASVGPSSLKITFRKSLMMKGSSLKVNIFLSSQLADIFSCCFKMMVVLVRKCLPNS